MFETIGHDQLVLLTLRAVIETALLAAALWILFFHLGLARELAKLRKTSLTGFLILIVAWSCIQLVDRWQYFYPQPLSFYPGARFAMYQIGVPTEMVESYWIEGVFRDGSTSELNLTEHFESIGLPSIHTRMRTLGTDLESDDTANVARARSDFGGFVEGLHSLLESRTESELIAASFHATRYRVGDRRLVRDTVLWRHTIAGGDQ